MAAAMMQTVGAPTIAVNMAIPNTMNRESLQFLGLLARTLPENAVVVEAGSLFGATAWVLSKNAPPSTRIYCIDPWEHTGWIDNVRQRFPDCPELSPEAFRGFTADCPNVIPVRGFSPEALDLYEPIDLFFEDATHSDPVFSANIARFARQLKPGGILAGDDYAPRWPTVVEGVRRQASIWRTPCLQRGQVWAMSKPRAGGGGTILDHLRLHWGEDVVVRAWRDDGSTVEASHGCWSAWMGDRAPIAAVVLDLPGFEDLDIEALFFDREGALVSRVGAGMLAWLGDRSVHRVKITLRGPAAERVSLAYQARFVDTSCGKDVWSAVRAGGESCGPALTSARLSGLRITIDRRLMANG